jgi:hypothetical protein
LLIAQVINTSTGSVGLMLNMTGLDRVSRNKTIFIAVLSISGYIIFIPLSGLIGSGLVKIIAMTLQSGYSVFMLYSKQRIQPFNKSYLKMVILFLVGAVAYYYLGNGILGENNSALWLFIGLCVTYAIFMVLFILFSTQQDKQFIMSLIRK